MGGISNTISSSFNARVTPVQDKKHKKNNTRSIFNQSQASRLNFHFIQRLTTSYSFTSHNNNQNSTYYNNQVDQTQNANKFKTNANQNNQNKFNFNINNVQNKQCKILQQNSQQLIEQSIFWVVNNIVDKKQKLYLKQLSKYQLMNNHRISAAHIQLDLFKNAPFHYGGAFINKLLFTFQDYQYLYMVQEYIPGFTLKKVLKNHFFTEEQTKYVVAALIQITQYVNSQGYALSQLTPQHILISKEQGKLKLLQIANPILIDDCYPYQMATQPCIYSAPEVLARDQILAQSDYYTIGMIMYEMMTQKSCIVIQNQNQFSDYKHNIKRNEILSHEIDIKKYNLPEGWNPQAADFLLKLLVKNPEYRLGRYGSFQLKSHPWLRNYNWDTLANRHGITLDQNYFSKQSQSQKFIEKVLKFKTKKQTVSQKNIQNQVKKHLNSNKKIFSPQLANKFLNQSKKNQEHCYIYPVQKTTKFIKLFENYKFSYSNSIKQEGFQQTEQNNKEFNKNNLKANQQKSKNKRVSISEKYHEEEGSDKSDSQSQKQKFQLSSNMEEIKLQESLHFDFQQKKQKDLRKNSYLKKQRQKLPSKTILQKDMRKQNVKQNQKQVTKKDNKKKGQQGFLQRQERQNYIISEDDSLRQ